MMRKCQTHWKSPVSPQTVQCESERKERDICRGSAAMHNSDQFLVHRRQLVRSGRESQQEPGLSQISSKLRLAFKLHRPAKLFLFACTAFCLAQFFSTGFERRIYFPFEKALAKNIDRLWPVTMGDRKEVLGTLEEVLVNRYRKFHIKQRFNPASKKLVWVGHGNYYGFGDRIRAILSAYLCAVLSERVLLILWDEPFPLSFIFRSATGMNVMYDRQRDSIGGTYSTPGRNCLRPWKGRCQNDDNATAAMLRLSVKETARRGKMFGHKWCDCKLENMGLLLSDERVVVVRSERAPSLRKLFAAQRRHAHLKTSRALRHINARMGLSINTSFDDALFLLIFKSIFKPAPEFLAHMGRHRRELRALVPYHLQSRRFGGFGISNEGKSRRYIAIHARLGYGLSEASRYGSRFDLVKKGVTMRDMAGCMAEHALSLAEEREHAEPQTFFIACDTPKFVPLLKEELGKRVKSAVVVENKSEKRHANKLRPNCTQDLNIYMNTAADLYLLAAGDALLSLPSGFANIARWFGGLPHVTVDPAACAKRRKK